MRFMLISIKYKLGTSNPIGEYCACRISCKKHSFRTSQCYFHEFIHYLLICLQNICLFGNLLSKLEQGVSECPILKTVTQRNVTFFWCRSLSQSLSFMA